MIHNRIKVLLGLSLSLGLSLTLCSTSVGQATPKITINDKAGAAAAISYGGDSQFSAVVAMILASNGTGDTYCTGVLVSPTTVLCARHCDIRTNEFVRFGPDSDNPVFSSAISAFSYPIGSPFSSLLDGGDFAIVTLATPVPSSVATPLRLTDRTTSLVGEEASLIGYGGAGLGSTGGDSSNVLRWGAQNIIDQYGSAAEDNFATGTNIISIDFDDGSAGNNFLGSSVPLVLEGTVAQGDSGGPVLIQENGEWLVAGVLSGGTTPGGVYGDVSWWTGVEPFKAEIEAAGGVFATEPLLGDVNRDSSVNFLDIAPFIALLSNTTFQAEADFDQNGFVNFLDISPFIASLSGQ